MKVEKIDHIHIYVKDLGAATSLFSRIMGTTFSAPITLDKFGLRSTLEPLGLELIGATTPEGPVGRAIAKKGEGLAAISLKVPDIEEAKKELLAMGLRLVSELETGGLKEAQFHPADAHGVMIELCEYDEVHGAVVAIHQGKKAK